MRAKSSKQRCPALCLIRLTSYWQLCISQLSDITKDINLKKLSQTKKRDYQLAAVSSL